MSTQLVAAINSGTRNAAYDYRLRSNSSFFDFLPKQQAMIVQNYFAMLRDRAAPAEIQTFQSNHLLSGILLTRQQRQQEIAAELPVHERLLQQVRASIPLREHDLLLQRASETIGPKGSELPGSPAGEFAPIRPLIEVRFP